MDLVPPASRSWNLGDKEAISVPKRHLDIGDKRFVCGLHATFSLDIATRPAARHGVLRRPHEHLFVDCANVRGVVGKEEIP